MTPTKYFSTIIWFDIFHFDCLCGGGQNFISLLLEISFNFDRQCRDQNRAIRGWVLGWTTNNVNPSAEITDHSLSLSLTDSSWSGGAWLSAELYLGVRSGFTQLSSVSAHNSHLAASARQGWIWPLTVLTTPHLPPSPSYPQRLSPASHRPIGNCLITWKVSQLFRYQFPLIEHVIVSHNSQNLTFCCTLWEESRRDVVVSWDSRNILTHWLLLVSQTVERFNKTKIDSCLQFNALQVPWELNW